MELKSEERDGALLVSVLDERVDAAVAIQFKDTMREVTATPHQRVVGIGHLRHVFRHQLRLIGRGISIGQTFKQHDAKHRLSPGNPSCDG